MTLTESSICLNDIRLYAFHGVLEQERRVGGEYSVSLRVHYNISKAMETDNVADTLNYAQLLEIVKREMDVPSNLLEHVAGRIGRTVFDEFPQAEAIDLNVTKLNPPMGADCAGACVHVHLINDKTQR
jgi:dihydroneopterin aldolase